MQAIWSLKFWNMTWGQFALASPAFHILLGLVPPVPPWFVPMAAVRFEYYIVSLTPHSSISRIANHIAILINVTFDYIKDLSYNLNFEVKDNESSTKWLCPRKISGTWFKKVCPRKNSGCNSHFSYAPKNIFFANFLFLSSPMPPKDLAPFLIYTPQKPSFNDKIWTIDFLSLVFTELSTATSANG